MTEALFLDDMYLKEFEGKVVEISDGKYITLDRTAFFPKSGGVACDTGTLTRLEDGEKFNVAFTVKVGKSISHEVDREGLQQGDVVSGRIDWERRYLLMRYHTAAHIISGIFWNEGQIRISGNEIDIDGGRMDFTLKDFNKEVIENYISKANEIVKQDLPIRVYYITRDELEKDLSLVKLAAGFPADIMNVRIVEIEGFDRQPDGGCHVRSTLEVGEIKLTKMKNKGKNNRRLYFVLEK